MTDWEKRENEIVFAQCVNIASELIAGNPTEYVTGGEVVQTTFDKILMEAKILYPKFKRAREEALGGR